MIELNTVSYLLVGYLQPLLAWLLNLMADKRIHTAWEDFTQWKQVK